VTHLDEPISLIGLPYQFGRRADEHGYQMARGPEVLLADDAAPSHLRQLFSDVDVTWLDELDDPQPQPDGKRPLPPGDQMIRQLVQNTALAATVRDAKANGRIPIVAAGGCNSSIGVVGGLADNGIGLIWFDAHADAETPDSSPDGLFEGMPVAVIAGLCWPRWRKRIGGFTEIPVSRIIQIGLHDRAFDYEAEDGFAGAGTGYGLGTVIDPPVVEREGYEAAVLSALTLLRRETDRVYVHIDADVIDEKYMRASLHVASGGPSPDQLRWSLDQIADLFSIEAVSFSSYDTAVDPHVPEILVPLIGHASVAAARSRGRQRAKGQL
jgi:arginase